MQRPLQEYEILKERNIILIAQSYQYGIKLILKLVKAPFINEVYESSSFSLDKDETMCRFFE